MRASGSWPKERLLRLETHAAGMQMLQCFTSGLTPELSRPAAGKIGNRGESNWE